MKIHFPFSLLTLIFTSSLPQLKAHAATDAPIAKANSVENQLGAYVGYGFIPRPATLAGAYYKFSKELVGEVSFATGGYSLKFGGNGVKSDRTHIAFGSRYFLGDSFNFSGGFAYDMISNQTSYDEFTEEGNTYVKLDSSIHQLEAEIGLGNRWQIGSFVLGCDWIGVGLPLAQLSKSVSSNEGAKQLGKVDEFESDSKKQSKMMSLHFLKVDAGYSF